MCCLVDKLLMDQILNYFLLNGFHMFIGLLKIVTKCLVTWADTASDSKPITTSGHADTG